MILHTLNKPPSRKDLTEELSLVLESADSLLLLEDGVYHLLDVSQPKNLFECASNLYVLEEDASARGISIDPAPHVKVNYVTYEEFVTLSLNHEKVISWY